MILGNQFLISHDNIFFEGQNQFNQKENLVDLFQNKLELYVIQYQTNRDLYRMDFRFGHIWILK